MQYGGHQKSTVSKVIARLDFFIKYEKFLPLLDCELIAEIHHLAIFHIAYRNLKFTNNFYF
jgi:hypothetical protein